MQILAMTTPHPKADAASELAEPHGSVVVCDMLGCCEHATGELQIGDEYIPLCEMHRQPEIDNLTPKWRPLPPHPPNGERSNRHE